jgi:hypothetical protein
MAKDGEVAPAFQSVQGRVTHFLGIHGGQVADPMIEAQKTMCLSISSYTHAPMVMVGNPACLVTVPPIFADPDRPHPMASARPGWRIHVLMQRKPNSASRLKDAAKPPVYALATDLCPHSRPLRLEPANRLETPELIADILFKRSS